MDALTSQWYLAGSLVVQLGFLCAAVWAVRGMLRNMRDFQEQMGVFLKLTLPGTEATRIETPVTETEELRASGHATPYLLEGWPAPAADQAAAATFAPAVVYRRSFWSGIAEWLNTPMASSGASPWRRAVQWLQAPAGS
jgi:hypothetical protein